MKRIKIETLDRIYYAKPLTLGQLEENEGLLNEIVAEEKNASGGKVPMALMRKQAALVQLALKNHDKNVDEKTAYSLSVTEIGEAVRNILIGTGLEEVPEGNAPPVA